MSDELQDALTSASSDPMTELKNDLGLTGETEAPKTEAKPEVDEPKAEKAEEKEPEEKPEKSDDEQNANKEERKPRRQDMTKREERQRMANRQLHQTINDLKAELESFKKTDKPAANDAAPKAPEMADFTDYDDYAKAESKYKEDLIQYKADLKFAEMQNEAKAREEQERQQREFAEKAAVFNEREAQFKARHKNYGRNAANMLETLNYLPAENAQGGQTLRQFVAESPSAPELIHHLGANPDLIEDITSSSGFDVMRALVKLEMSVGGKQAEAKKIPEPISKVKASNQGDKVLTDMSYKEMKSKFNL